MDVSISPISAPSAHQLLTNGLDLHYFCWNPADEHKPVALLQHGTGFVAATFDGVAQRLCQHFQVYAYDRRGHGLSSKVKDSYALIDFGEDCLDFCRAMDFKEIYGVGHSAGATDLLIAESLNPRLFNKLFLMEPTINDPAPQVPQLTQTEGSLQSRIEQARKRRSEFPSRRDVWQIYRAKPLFAPWTEAALSAYIYYGFAQQTDDSVVLQCHPELEAQILADIYRTFANSKSLDSARDPFAALAKITCPMAVSHSELSVPQFNELSRRARLHFPHAKTVYFAETGHCVPQEKPEALVQEVLNFWFED